MTDEPNSQLVQAIIPAAGKATRFGGVLKPLQPLGPNVVLDFAVAFAMSVTSNITVAIPEGLEADFIRAIRHADTVEWLGCEVGLGQGRTIKLLLDRISPLTGPVLLVFGDDVTPLDEARRVMEPVLSGRSWATQGVVWETDPTLLCDACAMLLNGRQIAEVKEKPVGLSAGWRGCAVYGLSESAAHDLVAVGFGSDDVMASPFNRWINDGRFVEAVGFRWNVNVNRASDLGRARSLEAYSRHLIEVQPNNG